MYNWETIRRRALPRTLFGRSLMIILTPLFLLQMIVAFVFFDRHWDAMTAKLTANLAGEIRLVADALKSAKTIEARADVVRAAAVSLDMLVSVENRKISDGSVQRTGELVRLGVDQRLKDALEAKMRLPFVIADGMGGGGNHTFEVRVQLDNDQMARFVCQDKRLSSSTTYIFILWMIGGAAVLFAIAILFMRNQIRPIRRLAFAAEKFGKGQDVVLKIEGASEVRLASRAFLEMRERLKRQIERRTAMLAGVSHDLRTPLTRMKLQLAMSKSDPEAANLRQDIDEMEKMIEGYLAFAKGESDEDSDTIDLKAVLDRVVAHMRRQGHDVQATLADRMMIRVRPQAVERALANVISNACKYGKRVWINAYARADAFEITVDDDGPGIPLAFREEVFRPFYRVEKSRNKKTGGIGLGLSIARDIIHGHGGEIFLEDSNRSGLRVVMRLPF